MSCNDCEHQESRTRSCRNEGSGVDLAMDVKKKKKK